MAEDGYRSDFVDDVNEEENENQNLVTDTTSAQARRGKDIQGIPWNRLNVTREQHRRARLKHYRNYVNIQYAVDNRYKQMPKGGYYYDFCHNSRAVRPTILHYELRNLVWATTKHDVYLLFNHSITHWSSLSKKLTETVNFFGHVAPTKKHVGSLLEGFARTLISTFTVDDGILVAGGFRGELVCKRLDRQGVSFCTRTSYEGINAITNGIEIYNSLR
ncbi:uncharacterized protein LOC143574863 [Bidens hawaiensis]|uniref:uncharacterized protein LOC143574863 n=1 Tax=Bidens hawaiensis TaxID=980011 RepID=UPI004049A9CF